MATLANLDELKARVDRTLDSDEERIGQAALEDASDLARYYGREWPTAASAPRLVKTLVLKAAARYMRNPEGYTQSRAGDETLAWNDAAGENAGTVYFTRDEQRLIAELAGRAKGLSTRRIVSHGPADRALQGFVPVQGASTKPFPYFSADESPW